jgi:hypothetical protein
MLPGQLGGVRRFESRAIREANFLKDFFHGRIDGDGFWAMIGEIGSGIHWRQPNRVGLRH